MLQVGDVGIELHASQLSDAWNKIVMTMKKRP